MHIKLFKFLSSALGAELTKLKQSSTKFNFWVKKLIDYFSVGKSLKINPSGLCCDKFFVSDETRYEYCLLIANYLMVRYCPCGEDDMPHEFFDYFTPMLGEMLGYMCR